MANLNLSEFGEKLFVADADHTFIWDTAASISKRVSRNSWLNSGTLTADAPVTISQTWNNAAVAFTGLKVVGTDTASAAASNLLELWAGATPALDFAVTKTGVIQAYGTYSSAGANYARLALACDSSGNATISTQALGTGTAGVLAFSPGGSERMRITTAGNVGIGTTAPTAPLHVQATAITGRESIIKASVSDDATSAFYLYNATSANNKFVPGFSGAVFDNTAFSCMLFAGQTNAANDTGTNPVVVFAARTTDSTSDPNNGTLAAVANRPLFSWQNLAVPQMQMAANGNLGIGTTSPTSKLHVNGAIIQKPDASATPTANGDLVVEATSNTTLTFKLKGTDGTVRSGTITLA